MTDMIIIDQIDKFLKNCFFSELLRKKLGKTKTKTAVKAIAGTISSSPIYLVFPKVLCFFKEFFNTWI